MWVHACFLLWFVICDACMIMYRSVVSGLKMSLLKWTPLVVWLFVVLSPSTMQRNSQKVIDWLTSCIINQLQFLSHRPLCVSADPWSSTEGGGVPGGKVAGGVAKGIQTNEQLDFRGNYHTKRNYSYVYMWKTKNNMPGKSAAWYIYIYKAIGHSQIRLRP